MPQPIDMQSELTRVSMAEKMQDAATRSSLAALARAQLEADADERIKSTLVNESDEAKESQIRSEERAKKDEQKRKKRKKKPKTESDIAAHVMYTSHEQKEVVTDPDDHNLDLMI